MRQPVTTANLQLFMKAVAASVTTPSRIFLVGGATSVMLGWRTSTIYHYDFYAQALAKIERGHRRDREDVDHMIKNDLVDPVRLLQLFSAIEDHLYLVPSLNPASFRRDVERIVREYTREQ
jgi:hypothetical protein